jgi:DNA-binding response OmpR family regulator
VPDIEAIIMANKMIYKILIIEDDERVQECYRVILAAEAIEIITALDGDEGLYLAQTKKPDLIITDILHPGLDGIGICNRLKADVNTSRIPIIVVAAGVKSFLNKCPIQPEAIICKPFDPEELRESIRRFLPI